MSLTFFVSAEQYALSPQDKDNVLGVRPILDLGLAAQELIRSIDLLEHFLVRDNLCGYHSNKLIWRIYTILLGFCSIISRIVQ